jgi:hypothetical protein
MQISEISFVDKIAYNIKADDTKKHILDSIEKRYNLKIITKHHERFDERLMPTINNNPHLVCARSNGNPYFLHMMKYNFTNYCVFIDKKIQQGYFYPRMIICNFHFDDSLFSDTILEGEMVKTKSGKWIFVFNDLLVLKGEFLSDSNVVKRLNLLYETLEKDFKPDDMDICQFAVKKYFKYDAIKELVNDHVPKLPYTCRGLYFKPLFLRFREILINFDDSVIKKVERKKYKNAGNFLLNEDAVEIIKQQEQIVQQNKECNFNIRKTSNPDIYELYDINSNKMDGTACIPTLKLSKAMYHLFQNKNVVDKVPIKCEFSEKWNKWVPML